MYPELLPLPPAAPALPPVNWPLELLKIFGPAIAVLIAAWVAYRFAKRGRKEDILYKERFKGFEEIAGYLFTIKQICDFNLNEPLFRDSNYLAANFLVELVTDLRQQLLPSKQNQPNDKHLVLLKADTRDSYHASLYCFEDLWLHISSMQIKGNSKIYHEDAKVNEKDFTELKRLMKLMSDKSKVTTDLAFSDLELPAR